MERSVRDVAASAVFVAVAGTVVWPPVEAYLVWSRLPALAGLGDAVVLPVVLVAVALGAAFGRVTGIGPRPFAAGTVVAYVAGMVALELLLSPASPVHLLLYGVLAVGFGAGVAGVAVLGHPGRPAPDR
ncbi:hypothetical protein [Halorientalis litorea]|jgi:hypothetical protein|uniref:hypothetical protein n=1 Tax=Halorientalis litorea TaxID=2931977 RepID=UPI001FF6858A|nr:hypothetical protein [Halorientalis litorea]